jgi:hypothetical protein
MLKIMKLSFIYMLFNIFKSLGTILSPQEQED